VAAEKITDRRNRVARSTAIPLDIPVPVGLRHAVGCDDPVNSGIETLRRGGGVCHQVVLAFLFVRLRILTLQTPVMPVKRFLNYLSSDTSDANAYLYRRHDRPQ
jgi:hypothetical protein